MIENLFSFGNGYRICTDRIDIGELLFFYLCAQMFPEVFWSLKPERSKLCFDAQSNPTNIQNLTNILCILGWIWFVSCLKKNCMKTMVNRWTCAWSETFNRNQIFDRCVYVCVCVRVYGMCDKASSWLKVVDRPKNGTISYQFQSMADVFVLWDYTNRPFCYCNIVFFFIIISLISTLISICTISHTQCQKIVIVMTPYQGVDYDFVIKAHPQQIEEVATGSARQMIKHGNVMRTQTQC